MPQIELVRPTELAPTGGSELTVTNRGSHNAYYGLTANVSSTRKIGTLIPGESLTLTKGFVWVVAEQTPVVLDLREQPTNIISPAAERVWPTLTYIESITPTQLGFPNPTLEGKNPHGIVLVGNIAYVCYWAGGLNGQFVAINLVTNKLIWSITIVGPRSVTLMPDGEHALVSSLPLSANGHLVMVNILKGEIVSEVELTKKPDGVALTSDGRLAFVGTEKGVYPVTINGTTMTAEAALSSSHSFFAGTILPNQTAAYMCSIPSGVLPIELKKTGSTWEWAEQSLIACTLGMGNIVSNAASTTLYTCGYGGKAASVIPPMQGMVIPITVASNTIGPVIPFPGKPTYLCWDHNEEHLVVPTYVRGSVLLVNPLTGQLGPEVPCGELTLRPTVTQNGETLYITSGLVLSNNIQKYTITRTGTPSNAVALADIIGSDGNIGGRGALPPSRKTVVQVENATIETTEKALVTMPLAANEITPGSTVQIEAHATIETKTTKPIVKLRIGPLGVNAEGGCTDPEVLATTGDGAVTTNAGMTVIGMFTCQAAGAPGNGTGQLLVIVSGLGVASSETATKSFHTTEAIYATLTLQAEAGTTPAILATNTQLTLSTI